MFLNQQHPLCGLNHSNDTVTLIQSYKPQNQVENDSLILRRCIIPNEYSTSEESLVLLIDPNLYCHAY